MSTLRQLTVYFIVLTSVILEAKFSYNVPKTDVTSKAPKVRMALPKNWMMPAMFMVLLLAQGLFNLNISSIKFGFLCSNARLRHWDLTSSCMQGPFHKSLGASVKTLKEMQQLSPSIPLFEKQEIIYNISKRLPKRKEHLFPL